MESIVLASAGTFVLAGAGQCGKRAFGGGEGHFGQGRAKSGDWAYTVVGLMEQA